MKHLKPTTLRSTAFIIVLALCQRATCMGYLLDLGKSTDLV